MDASSTHRTEISGTVQYVAFSIGREFFAIDIEKTVEIIRVSPITPVPKSKSYIRGVINLRGRIITVVDVRSRLQVTDENILTSDSRILILDNGARGVGVLVDSVENVIRLNEGDIEALPVTISSHKARFLKGIGKANGILYSIIAVEEVISPLI